MFLCTVDLTGNHFSPLIKYRLEELTAENLAQTALQLFQELDTLPGILKNSYRLEVFFEMDAWVMLIRVDVLAYFHAAPSKQQQFFQDTMTYLQQYLKPNEDHLNDPSPNTLNVPRELCSFHPSCTKLKDQKHTDEFFHGDTCNVAQKRMDVSNKSCGFFINTKLRISSLSQNQFDVLVRKEGKRDLLVIPHISNKDLHDNMQLATNAKFWKHVLWVMLAFSFGILKFAG